MDIGWVFWSGTIGMESPIPARVAAARAGGFTRVSLSAMDVVDAGKAGTTPKDLKRMLLDAGLDVVLDPLTNWFGGTPMPGRYSMSLAEQLRIAEAIEPVAFTVLGPFTDEVSIDRLSAPFAAVCDRAADVGALVQFEFMPMSKVTDLSTAWSIVAAANRPNGGLLFDTWHFYQGNPDFAGLESVPGDRIFGVQIADGTLADPDPFHRRLPGDGEFDLPRAIDALDRIGGLRWIGPEVLSPETAAMDPAEAGRVTAERVRALLRR